MDYSKQLLSIQELCFWFLCPNQSSPMATSKSHPGRINISLDGGRVIHLLRFLDIHGELLIENRFFICFQHPDSTQHNLSGNTGRNPRIVKRVQGSKVASQNHLECLKKLSEQFALRALRQHITVSVPESRFQPAHAGCPPPSLGRVEQYLGSPPQR